ncbi:MAG TPA: hypothetical protein VGQ36_14480 [Thermoanaerobaculia bacterium]|nr:hypothetical protein [Thermoanaerobaculia bacterium]
MILYRKVPQLRLRRASAPAAPFWSATTIAPYGARRATPVAIDYVAMRASGAEKLEVTICADVRDELDRARTIAAPVLIDAAENAEVVFRRGEEALAWCHEQGLAAQLLTSQANAVHLADADRFGVGVPVIFPTTTDLALLESLADSAQRAGAAFFAAIPIEVEATAKQALAQSMSADDDLYAMLFHTDVAPIQLATERHIAALASERGMSDFILPPRWEERSNWNAAVLLTLIASRMIAMELDLDLAGVIARSARTIAELDMPLTRIAESASLSIVGGVDETSVEMLSEWLATGSASFAEYVNEQWRLRRA